MYDIFTKRQTESGNINFSIIQVFEFKYLGHFITNDEHNDKDVLREVRDMFTHTNILARRFFSCSVSVKIVLFRTLCICFYGMELRQRYNTCSINRLRSSYIRCMKLFVKYPKVLQCNSHATGT